MGRDRPRSFHAGMVGCAATQRINRETRACGSAECNARERVVDRKGETRFQNETYSEGGINALSGISGRICLRCRTSHWRRVWPETNRGDAVSVGGFGEAVREHLEHVFGRQNVAFFASCGSSRVIWLENEPVFHTR